MARHTRNNNNRGYSERPASGLFSSIGAGSLEFRSRLLLGCFIVLAVAFLIQLLRLQVFQAADVAALGEQTRDAHTKILAHRGTIYDRNGNVLATSVEVKSVYCDPTLVSDVQEQSEDLVSVLGGTIEEYSELMTTPNSRYVCVARKIPVETAEKIAAMSLDGFYFEDELERVYPYGEVGGQIIGCLDSDGKGYTGLELFYDEILAGTDGEQRAQAGVGGAAIPGTVYKQVDAIDGEDIMVSLDIEMQAHVEALLKSECERLDATGSSCVLVDSKTGEIYASASLPLFNPGDRSSVEPGATDLKTATTAFEPGSVFKSVSALAVLEAGILTPDDEIDCPAELEADEYVIRDAHPRDDCTYSFRDILAYSSNVGISLAVEKLGFTPFYEKIQQYLLTQPTGVDIPNESAGYLSPRSEWSLIQGYNVTFGQGVMVTPMQIAQFYGMVLNKGVAVTPHFLMAMPQENTYVDHEEKVVTTDQKSLDTLISMLESVVDYGTGGEADIDGYDVAGKTSTAEVASEDGGYKGDVYNLAFCGFLPNSTSGLVCFVAANEVVYNTNVCPMFNDIMSYAIERYKISPK